MKNPLTNLTKHFLCISMILGILAISPDIYASNMVRKFEILEQENRISLVFLFEMRPGIGLNSYGDDRILLTLYDTLNTPVIKQKASETDKIALQNNAESPDLDLQINLDKTFKKIDCTWVPEKNILYLSIIPDMKEGRSEEHKTGKSSLKDIRFGSRDNSTRMVLTLDKKPSWGIISRDSLSILMKLDALADTFVNRNYGPVDLIKDMTIRKSDNATTLMDFTLQSLPNNISIFWLEDGNRLVMDLQREPIKMNEKTILLTAGFEKKEKDLFDLSKEEAHRPDTKSDPQVITKSQEMISHDGTQHVVRKRIQNNVSGSDIKIEEESEQSSGENIKFIAEPKLDDTVSTGSLTLKSVKNMSPKEAFLFGRIQQALEISDYEKGTLIIDQHLTEFPESSLTERLLFLRGDIYYNLSRKNDENASEKAIQSYTYAIDHYGKSGYSTMANIKASILESELDQDYKAIGRLSMVINKGEKMYLPLAYITRGRIYLKLEQYERAVEDFKVLLNAFPKSIYTPEAHFWIGNYYHVMGLYEEAEERLNMVSAFKEDFYLEFPEFLSLKAQNYIYLKKYDQARDSLFTALNLGNQPETSDLLLTRIGDTYHHQDKKKEAEKFYRIVLDYYPKTEGASIAKLRLADYYEDTSMLDDIANDENATSLSELASLEKAYQLYDRKQYQDVMVNLSDLIGRPVQTETRKEASRLFFQAAEKAIDQLYQQNGFNELVDLYYSEKERLSGKLGPKTMFHLGSALNKLNRPDEAISVLSRVKPYDFDGKSRGNYYMELADSYLALGEEDDAQKLLENREGEKLSSLDSRKMSLMLADIYMAKDMTDKAYPIYESLVREPEGLEKIDEVRAYLALGKIFYKKRDFERAKISLNRGIEIAEKYNKRGELLQQAHMEIGRVLYGEQKYQKAVDSFERGFSLGYGPEREDYWERRFQLALAYIGTGEESKAVPLLSEISDEGDAILQQKAQIRLGSIGLTRELRRLSISP